MKGARERKAASLSILSCGNSGGSQGRGREKPVRPFCNLCVCHWTKRDYCLLSYIPLSVYVSLAVWALATDQPSFDSTWIFKRYHHLPTVFVSNLTSPPPPPPTPAVYPSYLTEKGTHQSQPLFSHSRRMKRSFIPNDLSTDRYYLSTQTSELPEIENILYVDNQLSRRKHDVSTQMCCVKGACSNINPWSHVALRGLFTLWFAGLKPFYCFKINLQGFNMTTDKTWHLNIQSTIISFEVWSGFQL